MIDSPEPSRDAVEISPEIREWFTEQIEDSHRAQDIEWSALPDVGDVGGRLAVITRLKVHVPEGNSEKHKDTHNGTVENHLKMLLKAAGTRQNLEVFLGLAEEHLGEPRVSEEVARHGLLLWAPAAEIIGRHDLKERIEDRAFTRLFPAEKAMIAETYALLGDRAVETVLNEYGFMIGETIDEALPELAGKTRVEVRRKSDFSIWRKCQQRQRSSYEVPDFFGIRVVIPSENDEKRAIEQCYVAVGALSDLYEPDLNQYVDYIAEPKPNGYQSFHLALGDSAGAQMEVQVRTSMMHARAEADPTMSHMGYDASMKITPGKFFRGGLRRNQKTYRWRHEAARQLEKSPEDTTDLCPGEVLVFTPDGNLFSLPDGATMLDFAFAVHDRRALRTSGFFVNGKPARFTEAVRYGDTVDIRYGRRPEDKRPTWNEGWLQIVTTRRAQRRIRRALKEQHQTEYVAQATKVVKDQFPDLENPLEVLSPADHVAISRKYCVQSVEQALREIGAGVAQPNILIGHIARQLQQ